MKDLDFLPDWFRANRQRRLRQHRRYVLFGLIVSLMAAASFVLDRSVSHLEAQSVLHDEVIQEGQQIVQRAMEMETNIAALRRQTEILQTLTPRTDISAILSELSHCVSEKIILSRVTIVQEPVEDLRPDKNASAGSLVRIGAAKTNSESALPQAPQRSRLTLTGIADGGGTVARLIENLETSAYFESVSPGYSRSGKVGSKTVTEFEIVCIVADYQIKRAAQ